MLSYTELKRGIIITIDGQPYEILEAEFSRKQKQKAVIQAKIKNLITGKVVSRTIHQNEQFEEPDVEKRIIKYLYNHREQYFFCELNDASKRFSLDASFIGNSARFLKQNSEVNALSIDGKIINIKLPIKVELKVGEAPPGDKGDTATGGKKPITLETGAIIQAPLFIKEGDTVRVNTETGEYAERTMDSGKI